MRDSAVDFAAFFFKAACPLALGLKGALPPTRPFWHRHTFVVGRTAPRYTAPSHPVLHSGPNAYCLACPALSRLGQLCSLLRCNASFPCSRASLLLPRTVCPCPAYLHREATRVAAEYARVPGAAIKTRESMGKKRYNARDRVGYFRPKCDFDPLELEFWKDFWTRESPHQGRTFA